jgi:hypothetical protein
MNRIRSRRVCSKASWKKVKVKDRSKLDIFVEERGRRRGGGGGWEDERRSVAEVSGVGGGVEWSGAGRIR